MIVSKLVVEKLLTFDSVLEFIYSYPIFLNEYVDVPKTEAASTAWGSEDLYVRFNNLINVYPFLVRNKKVVDLGCNIGTYSFAVSPLAKHVTGIDREEYILYMANFTKKQKQTTNVDFVLDDALTCSLDSYDSIIMLGNLLGMSPKTPEEEINPNTERAVAFYNKLNTLDHVCVIADLAEDPNRLIRNFLYTDIARETLRGFVIKKYDRFMMYIKE